MSAPFRRCEACRKAKSRCDWAPSSSSCIRCTTKGLSPCVPQISKALRAPRKPSPRASASSTSSSSSSSSASGASSGASSPGGPAQPKAKRLKSLVDSLSTNALFGTNVLQGTRRGGQVRKRYGGAAAAGASSPGASSYASSSSGSSLASLASFASLSSVGGGGGFGGTDGAEDPAYLCASPGNGFEDLTANYRDAKNPAAEKRLCDLRLRDARFRCRPLLLRGAVPDVLGVLGRVQQRKVNVMFGCENLEQALATNKGYQVVRDGDNNDVKPTRESYALTHLILSSISEYTSHLPRGSTQLDLHEACHSDPRKFGPIIFGGGPGRYVLRAVDRECGAGEVGEAGGAREASGAERGKEGRRVDGRESGE